MSLLEMPAPPAWVWSLPCRWQDSHWLQDTVSHSLFLWQEKQTPQPLPSLCALWTCPYYSVNQESELKPTSAWTQKLGTKHKPLPFLAEEAKREKRHVSCPYEEEACGNRPGLLTLREPGRKTESLRCSWAP